MNCNILDVWAGTSLAGKLLHEQQRKYVFTYGEDSADTVSLTMPLRMESWVSHELHPVFQMNLPEGALLEAIREAIAKIVGDDDISLLTVTGGNQIGKNQFMRSGESPSEQPDNIESLSEILAYPDTTELFHELVNRYAMRSGVSGVQPKVLLDAQKRGTLAAHKYIVKSSGDDYPHLAANEFFCMTAAQRAGLPVHPFYLAENGGLFVMQRFDISDNGNKLGFEDMCSLMGVGTRQKYRGTYERIAKALRAFISSSSLTQARKQFFATLVLSSMVRNGDAHLKNFGVLYESAQTEVSIAPVYDIVTTAAYIHSDVPALSIDGRKKWWPRKMLEKYARGHLFLTNKEIAQIIEQTAEAVAKTRSDIADYMVNHPDFSEIGGKMMACWEEGMQDFSHKER